LHVGFAGLPPLFRLRLFVVAFAGAGVPAFAFALLTEP
jgi:hypothetical protein